MNRVNAAPLLTELRSTPSTVHPQNRKAVQTTSFSEGWLTVLTSMLRKSPTPSILIAERAHIIATNPAGQQFIERKDDIRIRGGRLTLVDVALDRKFHSALGKLVLRNAPLANFVVGLAVNHYSGAYPYYLRMSQIGSSSTASGRFVAKIEVNDPCADTVLDDNALRELFELTPRETEVAQALANGLSIIQASKALGIRHETARSHLKQLFQKTQTSRQAQLVRLLLLCSQNSGSID